MQIALYIASALGAFALYLIMPKRRHNLAVAGGILGAATLGGLWLVLSSLTLGHGLHWSPWYWMTGHVSEHWPTMAYYYVFSFIAIVAAVRVITHTRPVYSALWFVLVVLSTAALFVVLSAEFMAFAMVIIYAGAILVTYMFVIMLATQAGDPQFDKTGGENSPEYDRIAREPVAAAAVGFLLLAVLLSVSFRYETMEPNPAAAAPSSATLLTTTLAKRARTPQAGPESRAVASSEGPDQAALAVESGPSSSRTPPQDRLSVSNVDRVGLNLFQGHPLGLELAGVILLVSLIGAVVIARTQVEEEEESITHGP